MPSSNPTYIAAALDQLFDLPLDLQPDIDEVIDMVDATEARRYLVERLGSEYQRGDSPVFQTLFHRLGIDEVRKDLIGIFGSGEAAWGARACALEVLCRADRGSRKAMLAGLDSGSRKRIVDEPLRELVADAIEDADAGKALAFVAEHFPESRRLPFEQHIEIVRKQMGATAATVYQPLLCSKRLESLREEMIRAIVEEAAPDARHALECLIRGSEDGESRARFERALRELESRPGARPVVGSGRIGPIDGPGRYEVALIVENPDGTRTLAFMLLGEKGLLDGFVDFDPPADLLESAHLPRVEVSASCVASLVRPILETTVLDELDSMTRAAVRYFLRLPEPSPLERCPPAPSFDPPQLHELLARSEYRLWAFTPEDFHDAGIPEPPVKLDSAWITAAINSLDTPRLRSRLIRDVEFMSCWHLAAGEPDSAAMMARIAREMEQSFASHPLVRAMVDRSLEILHSPDLRKVDDEGDDGFDLDEIHGPKIIRDAILFDIVGRQIRDDDPVGVRAVFEALCCRGLDQEEAKRSMAEALETEIRAVIESERPHDPVAYLAALRKLL